MYTFSARWDTKWVSFTPLHEHTLTSAREIAISSSGPFAGAIVGVYGSGKSTLAFTLLQESMEAGQWSIWDEAAPFIDRLVPEGTKVLPQEFAARVRAWVQAITSNSEEQEHYRQDLIRRGHQEVADRLLSREPGERAPHVLLGYFCTTPRICSAPHIRGYAESMNMRSILPLDGSNSFNIK